MLESEEDEEEEKVGPSSPLEGACCVAAPVGPFNFFLTLYFVSGRGIWSELGYKVIILAKRQRKIV